MACSGRMSVTVDPGDLRVVLRELGRRTPDADVIAAADRLRDALQPRLFDPARALTGLDKPHAAHHAGADDVERAAADRARPWTGGLRRRVFIAIAAAGAAGLTNAELAARTGIKLYSAAPRATELRRGGWIRDSGERRDGRKVWIATEEGVDELHREAAREEREAS